MQFPAKADAADFMLFDLGRPATLFEDPFIAIRPR
jgi:hypothetical protein